MFQSLTDAIGFTTSDAETRELQAAKKEEVDSDLTFEVSKEELSIIRAELAGEYPEDYTSLSDDYVESVASKPYSKDPTKRRPLDYTTTKLKDLLKWRETNAVHLKDQFNLIPSGNDSAGNAVENPTEITKAKALATSLNYASIYWHGLDKSGRPILWLRTDRMPWYPDVESQVNSLILLADEGINLMPKGITDFVVVSDSHSPPPPNPQFMMNLLSALVKGYPDRLSELVSCPVGKIIQMVMSILLPLMPSRLASKIVLISEEDTKSKLKTIFLNGEDDIPTFLGGTADHDQYYPKEGKFPDRNLTFDYEGMLERLAAANKEFKPLN